MYRHKKCRARARSIFYSNYYYSFSINVYKKNAWRTTTTSFARSECTVNARRTRTYASMHNIINVPHGAGEVEAAAAASYEDAQCSAPAAPSVVRRRRRQNHCEIRDRRRYLFTRAYDKIRLDANHCNWFSLRTARRLVFAFRAERNYKLSAHLTEKKTAGMTNCACAIGGTIFFS